MSEPSQPRLLQIAVAAPLYTLYTYHAPEKDLDLGPGHLVEVPFGRGRRRGVVVEETATAPPGMEIKAVLRRVEPEPVLSPALLRLLRFAWEYTLSPPGEMVFAALPPAFHRTGRHSPEKRVRLVGATSAGCAVDAETLPERQREILLGLRRGGEMPLARLCRNKPSARAAVLALKKKGLVDFRELVEERRPRAADLPVSQPPAPTPEQQTALAALSAALQGESSESFLLFGVTGSGKTEVYLRAIGETLSRGRGALLLVPEIALTPQLIARVTARFGEQVAVLHSGLTEGERLDEWRRLQNGRARVAVGARSAIFAPVLDLGLIVVDEEHDPSYKQSERLPYHARDLALVRGREEKAVVVLGSATPSAESLHRVGAGRMRQLFLSKRIQQRALPTLEVIDLKHELLDPLERPHVLGPRLAQALAETLDRGEQAILFLNRRGYSSVALCRDCGQGVRCQNCSIALTHHLSEARLRCHYCGLAMPLPRVCPACGGGRIALFGLGTEKCEEEVRRRFPGARIARLDSDTAAGRGVLLGTLERFAGGDLDVLIGTQMVTKGHDIPNVTLVGVLLADLGLQVPDFRAAERTFQLLVQVAGRAGRGARPGTVIVQTFLPLHPAIQAAREDEVLAFMQREIERRQQLGYPPARRLLLVRAQHERQEVAAEAARRAAAAFRRLDPEQLSVLGPSPSPLERLRGVYRFQLLVKSRSIARLLQTARQVREQVQTQARLNFDVDPFDML